MTRKLKHVIDAGDVDAMRGLLARQPELASTLISWGSFFCRCRTEPHPVPAVDEADGLSHENKWRPDSRSWIAECEVSAARIV